LALFLENANFGSFLENDIAPLRMYYFVEPQLAKNRGFYPFLIIVILAQHWTVPLFFVFFCNFQNLPNTNDELVEFDESTIDDIISFFTNLSNEIEQFAKQKKDQHPTYDYGPLMNRIDGLCTSIKENGFVRKVPEELALFKEWRKCR
jgi:hypothetical protein